MSDEETPAAPEPRSTRRTTRASSQEPESSSRLTRSSVARVSTPSKKETASPAKKTRSTTGVTAEKKSPKEKRGKGESSTVSAQDTDGKKSTQVPVRRVSSETDLSFEASSSAEKPSLRSGSLSPTIMSRAARAVWKSTSQQARETGASLEEISEEAEKDEAAGQSQTSKAEVLVKKTSDATAEQVPTKEPTAGAVACSSPPKISPRSSDASDSGSPGKIPSKSEAAKITPERLPTSVQPVKHEALRETTDISSEVAKELVEGSTSGMKASPMRKPKDQPASSKESEAPDTSAQPPKKPRKAFDPNKYNGEEVMSSDDLFVPFERLKLILDGDPSAGLQLVTSRPRSADSSPCESPPRPEELPVWEREVCEYHKRILSPSVRESLGILRTSGFPELDGKNYPCDEDTAPLGSHEPCRESTSPEIINDILRKMGLYHAISSVNEKENVPQTKTKIKKPKYVVTPMLEARYIPSPVYTIIICNVPAKAKYSDVRSPFVKLNLLDIVRLYRKSQLWVLDFFTEYSLEEAKKNYDKIKILDVQAYLLFVGRTNEDGGEKPSPEDPLLKSHRVLISGVPMNVSARRILRDLKAQDFENIEKILAAKPAPDSGKTTMKLFVTFKSKKEEPLKEGKPFFEIGDTEVKIKLMEEFESDGS